jgi:hypothetical protein
MAKELCVLRICKETFGQVNALELGFERAHNAVVFTYVSNVVLFVVYMYNSVVSYAVRRLCCSDIYVFS